MTGSVKAPGAPRGARVIDGAVFDARSEATQIVEEARAAADEIRQQARADGLDAARAEATELLARARQAADRRAKQAERELRTLAVRIAERLIKRQLQLAPELVVEISRGALAEARGRHDFVLRVHPDDVVAVQEARPGLLGQLSVSAQLVVRADESVPRGGCVVESEVGTVDARLDSQLAAIQRALAQD